MRNVLSGLALAAAIALPLAAQEDTVGDWFDDYPQALAEARRTNKPIFLEFRCEA